MNAETVWYVDARGDRYTHEVLENMLSKESLCPDMLCPDGKRRHIFRCSPHIVVALLEVRNTVELPYVIYVEEAGSGKLKNFNKLGETPTRANNEIEYWPRRD